MSGIGNNNQASLKTEEESDETEDENVESSDNSQDIHQNANGAHEDLSLPPLICLGYRDYSKVPYPGYSRTNGTGFQNFPMKLFVILSSAEHDHICSWLPHGRSWIIHDTTAFEKIILPRHFRYVYSSMYSLMIVWFVLTPAFFWSCFCTLTSRHARYASFARQINGWGFRRIISGPDYNSYCK